MTEDHYLREKIRQTLATDPHVGILNVRVQIEGKRIILYGEVSSTGKGRVRANSRSTAIARF
ncbi:MAG: BON domain-containing protein [Candidatus Manganitrophus sp.]|nr:BON domain-containing protein [Candidatus Manganitrophus sp.]